MTCDADSVITSGEIVNGKSNIATIKTVVESVEDSTTTPDGKTIDTLRGALKKLGWESPPVAYAGSISFTVNDGRKIIERSGVTYAPLPSELPFTTTGTWGGADEDKFYPITLNAAATSELTDYVFSTVATMATRTTSGGVVISPVLGRKLSTLGHTAEGDGLGGDYIVTNDTANGSDLVDLGGGFTATLIGTKFSVPTKTTLATMGFPAGAEVETLGYYAVGDGGESKYIIKTAAQAATDGDVIDGYGNITLANGNAAIIQEITAEDFGCLGVVDSVIRLQAATEAGSITALEGSSFDMASMVTLHNNLSGGTYNHTDVSQAFTLNSGSSGITIENVTINSTKHGVQHTAVCDNTTVKFCDINVTSFGLLYNDASDGSKNARILFNNISSDVADAIELNNPTGNSSNALIVGNTLNGAEGDPGLGGGFCVGIAGVNSTITALNCGEGSANRSYHVEDERLHGGIHLGNIWPQCNTDGAFILPQYVGAAEESDGLISVANFYEQGGGSGKAGTIGINHTWRSSAEGSLNNCVHSANYVKGFESGVQTPARELLFFDGNVLKDCDIAVRLFNRVNVVGDSLSDECDTLVRGDYGGMVGGVHSTTHPVNIIDNAGLVTTQPGATIQRFSFSLDVAHTGSGVEAFNLFKTPRMMNGKIMIQLVNTTNYFTTMADVYWDGSSITDANKTSHVNGSIGATVNLVEASGQIGVSFSSGTAINAVVQVFFDGFYYVSA